MNLSVTCNTEDDVLFQNVAQNSALPIEWVTQQLEHNGHAVIVGGGPSLLDTIESIRWRQSIGQTIFALNGAAKTLIEHGITVDYTVIIDARKFNAKFIGYSTKYLLSSQCDPELFNIVPDAILWHPVIDGIENYIPDRECSLIGGGTTVGLSAMCLAYTLGFRKLHLYGFDSSHREKSHAYPQPENENEPVCRMTVFGKTFKTSWTMAKQAELFPSVCDSLIEMGCIITVDGDGLIPHIVRNMPKNVTYNQLPETQSTPITVAFVWRGEHVNGIPTEQYAPKMLNSIRKILPNAHVIQITYPDFKSLDGVDEVLRIDPPWPDYLKSGYQDRKYNDLDRQTWACEAYARILERGQNVLFIGTDVIIQKDITKVFQADFDIASSRYPKYTRNDGTFCWDVQFAKPSAAKFFRDMIVWYNENTSRDMEEDGQTAFTKVADEGKYKVLNLDSIDFCHTPESQDEDVSNSAIVHYRGPRKQWM